MNKERENETLVEKIIRWFKNHPVFAPIIVLIMILGGALTLYINYEKAFPSEDICPELGVRIDRNFQEIEKKLGGKLSIDKVSPIEILLNESIDLHKKLSQKKCDTIFNKLASTEEMLISAIYVNNKECDKLKTGSEERLTCFDNLLFMSQKVESFTNDNGNNNTNLITLVQSIIIDLNSLINQEKIEKDNKRNTSTFN